MPAGENGSYMSDTAVMEAYEGYWVKVKKTNIYLNFPVAAQTELTNEDMPPAASLVRSYSEDSPPLPIGVEGDDAYNDARRGCFIDIAATDSFNRGTIATVVLIFLILVFLYGAIKAVHHRA